MTPQLEESPDEILASAIDIFKTNLDLMELATKYAKKEGRPSRVRYGKHKATFYRQGLAMLEAMRAARACLKVMADIAVAYGDAGHDSYPIRQTWDGATGEWIILTLGQCRQAREAYRQSDDAIRGMRG